MKAFSDWQRRKAVDDIDAKKNLHISAVYSITEWKKAEDQTNHIEALENWYERLKDVIWEEPDEREKKLIEARAEQEDDPFLQAGKRNMTRVVENLQDTEIKGPSVEELDLLRDIELG